MRHTYVTAPPSKFYMIVFVIRHKPGCGCNTQTYIYLIFFNISDRVDEVRQKFAASTLLNR